MSETLDLLLCLLAGYHLVLIVLQNIISTLKWVLE
jgi:hypothetical protein